MIRFNKSGKFNVPFGHKPNRFSKSYITKICNQIDYISQALKILDWTFICQDFNITIKKAKNNDVIYCDPPYLGRHVDYFDSWDAQNEMVLFDYLSSFKGKYILSTWHSNKYRKNEELNKFDIKNVLTKEHFYHVGASEKNRNSMTEALILNYKQIPNNEILYKSDYGKQLRFLEPRQEYLQSKSASDDE